MKALLTFFTCISLVSVSAQNWNCETRDGFSLCMTSKASSELTSMIKEGSKTTSTFFGSSFPTPFQVNVHPNRSSLDAAWQQDWGMPDFHSECWMVASGIATKLDLLSPAVWKGEACEHDPNNTLKTQQLITHELVHVYHGQHNPSPDFSEVSGLDWFVEGLATYASGQLDSARLAPVKAALLENKMPTSLDDFWTGKLKYGLSGSVVHYLDQTYGRSTLTSLLQFTKKEELLAAINTTESDLLANWKKYIGSVEIEK